MIRREYSDETSQPLERTREDVFGPVLEDKTEVEMAVKRAQKAILNPSQPTSYFVNCDASVIRDSGANELKFTKNLIVLEITGASVNLTLIDLPGIIRTTEREEDSRFVDLILDLTKLYIGQKGAVIVAAITCKQDIDTQGVHDLARQADPQGERTIGVLTKADAIEEGCHGPWLDIMQGRRFPLKLGYYMVRNPNKVEVDKGVTFQEAVQTEQDFFEGSSALAELRADRRLRTEHLGITSLTNALSTKLRKMTIDQVPFMLRTVDARLREVGRALAELPDAVPAGSRSEHLRRLIHSLEQAIRDVVAPRGRTSKSLVHDVDAECDKFVRTVMRTRPRFQLGGEEGDSFVSYGEEDRLDVLAGQQPDAGAVVASCAGGAQAHTQEGDDDPSSRPERLSIADVERIVSEERAGELPSFTPYEALLSVIYRFQGKWALPVEVCLERVADKVQDRLMALVGQHTARFDRLLRRISPLVAGVVDARKAESGKRLRQLLDMESSMTMTKNHHYFTDSRQRFMEQISSKLAGRQQAIKDNDSNLNQALAYINASGLGLSKEQLVGMLLKSKCSVKEETLNVIASTMAYFKVSAKRFCDYVPMTIWQTMMHGLDGAFVEAVARGLSEVARDNSGTSGIGGTPDVDWASSPAVLGLLDESEELVRTRDALHVEKERLLEMRRLLREF